METHGKKEEEMTGPFFFMIGAELTEEQISDCKRVIELLIAGSTDNFVIAYGPTAQSAYSEVKKELGRFVPPSDSSLWC